MSTLLGENRPTNRRYGTTGPRSRRGRNVQESSAIARATSLPPTLRYATLMVCAEFGQYVECEGAEIPSMHGAYALWHTMPRLHCCGPRGLHLSLAVALARSGLQTTPDPARPTSLQVRSLQLASPSWLRSLPLARSAAKTLYHPFRKTPVWWAHRHPRGTDGRRAATSTSKDSTT
jgi:hypothetical protein